MTNDELEAYRAMPGVMDNRSLGNALRDKLPGILDEVERLREERAQASDAANDWHGKSAYEEDRATRAEAHAEMLAKNLERLGSMEAFEYARPIDKARDAELLARVEYARQALSAYNQRTET